MFVFLMMFPWLLAEDGGLRLEAPEHVICAGIHEDTPEPREDVPGQASHKDQVHPDIPAEEPAQQKNLC